ncbi:MAG: histidinol-phosphatase [Clostridia bacterium]|nr:histidinol-phosphatase [Clostridia bacterium]
MQYSNLHTHTTFSDGKNTPREMVEKALELGFSSFGFSDHSEFLFDRDFKPASGKDLPYRKEIGEIIKEYEAKLDILCGIERDYFTKDDVSSYEYVIGSVHYIRFQGEIIPLDWSRKIQEDFIQNGGRGEKNELAKRYYELIAEFAQEGSFEILGHFDLINKFGLFDDEDELYRKIALEALDEVLKKDIFIEINTGAISRGYRKDPYPDAFFLKYIQEKGGKIVLNGDSHDADSISTHFDESVELMKKIGFDSLWQLKKSGWEEITLD